MPSYHATITGPDQAAMAALVSKYKVTVARHTVEKVAGGFRVDAHASGTQLRALEKAGYAVERLEDADKTGKARQKETRKLTAQAVAPEALKVAQSTGYLNIDEVEAALAAAALAPNKAFTKLISLPNKTWEQRTCHALKLAKGSGGTRAGIYLLGGVHAREWGSPDILIHFVQLVCDAYRTNTGITIATKKFTAAQIQSIVETKDIYIFPQANPDGRHYSMTTEPMWRKNRRPAPAGHTQTQCVGVDINRNYDFLWDFPTYFDPASPITNSVDPCDHDVYIGPSAASEPETKNAVWMFDKFPNIRYFVDLHSYSEDILYNWGDDENQTTSPVDELPERVVQWQARHRERQGLSRVPRGCGQDDRGRSREQDARCDQGGARPRLQDRAGHEPLSDGRHLGRLRLQPAHRESEEGEGVFVHGGVGKPVEPHAVSSGLPGDEADHRRGHFGAAGVLHRGVVSELV